MRDVGNVTETARPRPRPYGKQIGFRVYLSRENYDWLEDRAIAKHAGNRNAALREVVSAARRESRKGE